MTRVTKADALLAVDAAMAALAVARSVLASLGEDPVDEEGRCRHLRTVPTGGGEVCRDCGDVLTGDGVPLVAPEDPTATLDRGGDS